MRKTMFNTLRDFKKFLDVQAVQTRYANRYQLETSLIKIENWVLLRWKTKDKTKFASITDGLFQVLQVGTNNVKLKFPKKQNAHPIVNISRVQSYFRPRPELITEPPKNDIEHEYPVDRVMDHKVINRVDYYYIHRKEYPAEDDTWEPITNLTNVWPPTETSSWVTATTNTNYSESP